MNGLVKWKEHFRFFLVRNQEVTNDIPYKCFVIDLNGSEIHRRDHGLFALKSFIKLNVYLEKDHFAMFFILWQGVIFLHTNSIDYLIREST